ncbi:hypothetical protein CERSUDRAFT_141580 [Gelatoporia subvermispora B]|uniref:CNH domain-containing protein n=1 Tax=Ceriporiopsis subvermispora (strain B) TaxID=914234 RepID=M2QAV3_CERS8|nr:hypothetical protein CERSUDRAFT_141580 [Gelatoporia subvermispora B]
MAPFHSPRSVLTGFKERAESLTAQGDRLYIGTSTGNLHVYTYGDASSEAQQLCELVETKKSLCRRAIDQLGYVKDVNSLVVLSESSVTLYPLPTFSPTTPLVKAKAAFSFAVHTWVIHVDEPVTKSPKLDETDFAKAKPIPAIMTYLAVGCRRKMVIYSWQDGEPQDVQEALLPHSPRAMVFIDSEHICFGYSPTEYAVFSLKTSVTTDVVTPLPTAPSSGITNMGMGALSGLGGYMTLGLGAKPKPCVVNSNESEALVAKDNNGFFIDTDGKSSRSHNIDWPAPPEELTFVRPYIFSILPPGSVPMSQIDSDQENPPKESFATSSVIEIRSSLSLKAVQTLAFPPTPLGIVSPAAHYAVRLMTPSPATKSSLFLLSTPTDRASANTAGTTIWQFQMKSWSEQLDELVGTECYADALALLDTLDPLFLPDKERRQRLVRALHAVAQFSAGRHDDAINAFIDLDINPAKVVALYPESIAGRLSVPKDQWIPLFGGPAKPPAPAPAPAPVEEAEKPDEQQGTPTSSEGPARVPSPKGSIRGALKTGLEAVVAAAHRDDETASIRSVRRPKKPDEFHRSVETLMRFLSDRRPKVAGALETFGIRAAQSHKQPHLSAASTEELFRLPNAPLNALTPEELVRFAQIVDTALFKSYLLVKPSLLGPLCRIGNWCEVEEVEEVLRAHEKYSELIFLYNGKRMHAKALDLLRHLSEKETDMRDKLMPSVTYLQRLGPEHLDLIFECSRWVFEEDADIGFEIFTSEETELPRQQVVEYLEKIEPGIGARYLEHLIQERGEEAPLFHDWLAELYLRMTLTAKKQGNSELYKKMYTRLLNFIDTTHYYHTDRLYGLLPSDDLFEAKAILLGRLGRHDAALEVYVYRLHDYTKAEEYCKRIYTPGPDSPTSSVFLTLLRIYLRPSPSSALSPTSPHAASPSSLLAPALALIRRHGPRLDTLETLHLLPPLVPAADVRPFLLAALRAPVFDRRVVREVTRAREEQVARKLMLLQSRRVRVSDSRICPQCHKRIGHSVIAVHAPRGEVTHYQCREAFSRKLKEMRV